MEDESIDDSSNQGGWIFVFIKTFVDEVGGIFVSLRRKGGWESKIREFSIYSYSLNGDLLNGEKTTSKEILIWKQNM